MLRFGQEFHVVPALFHLLLKDHWPKCDDSWSPGFSEPTVLIALYANGGNARVGDMGEHSGSVVYSDSAYRQSCQRLAERNLVERIEKSRWRLTPAGAEYVKAAVEATCRQMSIRFDGIIWVRPTLPGPSRETGAAASPLASG
jgi:hypothetical protein